jgi:hypothetical protein
MHPMFGFFYSLLFIANVFGMESPAKKQCVKPTVECYFKIHEIKGIRYCDTAVEYNKEFGFQVDLATPFIPIALKKDSRCGDALSICLWYHGVPLSCVLQKEFIMEKDGVRYRFINDMSKLEEDILAKHLQEFECKPSLRSIFKDPKNLLEAGIIEWDEKSFWYKHGPNSYFALKEKRRKLLWARLIPYTTLNFDMLTLLASYKRS